MAGDFIQRSRHGTVFYFRRRVPNDLRGKLGRTHLYLTLRTEQLAEARVRARALAVATDQLFLKLRYGEVVKVHAKKVCENVGQTSRPTNNRVEANTSDPAHMFDSTESLTFGYGLTVEFDDRGRPKIAVSDAKPGDEPAIASVLEGLHGLAKPSAASGSTSPAPTIAEAMETILASPDLKPTSKMQYRRAFAFFATFFGRETRLSEVRAEEFSSFADHVRNRAGWAPNVRRHHKLTPWRHQKLTP